MEASATSAAALAGAAATLKSVFSLHLLLLNEGRFSLLHSFTLLIS